MNIWHYWICAKLAILADAAKYDAPCSSSGTAKRKSAQGGKGLGFTQGIVGADAATGRLPLDLFLAEGEPSTHIRFALSRPTARPRDPDGRLIEFACHKPDA